MYKRNKRTIIHICLHKHLASLYLARLAENLKVFKTILAGVYFPKYVRDICMQLGICGWVKNSKTGTILGKMQGPRALVDQM